MQIYSIRNDINDKIYIGKTVTNAKIRWAGHIYQVKNNDHNALHNAMRKYGIEHFFYQVIEDNIKTKEELAEKEKYYIQKLNTIVPNGYNIASGGKGGNGTHAKNLQLWRQNNPDLVQRNNQKLKEWRAAHPEEIKEGNIRGAIKRKEKYPNITKKANQASKKQVRCIETGEIYQSANAAAKAVGGSNGAHIGQVCNGKRITAYKKHWEWVKKG